jgi:hypothetical protein
VLRRLREPGQYTSLRFTDHLALEGIAPSVGTVGDAYDNALMESVIGLFKTECIATTVFHPGPYKTLADVEYATAGWVDWYNHRRLHGSLGMVPPAEYESHPPPAVGGRRGTPTRRPPRRSPLVAHPRSATADAEPGPCKQRGSPSDEPYDHDLTRTAATGAALGAASRVRPEPLKPRQIATRRSVSVGLLPNPC